MAKTFKSLEVEIFNVGHGEAIRIAIAKEITIIRDFGRSISARNTSTSLSVDDVLRWPLVIPFHHSLRNQAVLSHAHEDHYNGFERLFNLGYSKIFSHAYVPWIDFSTLESLGMAALRIGLYLFVYSNTPLKVKKEIKNWGRVAPVMAALAENFHGVIANYQFDWPIPNKALWPPFIDKDRDMDVGMLNSLREAIKSEINNDPDIKGGELIESVEHSSFHLHEILKRYYPKIKEGHSQHPENNNPEKDVEIIDDIYNRLLKYSISGSGDLDMLMKKAEYQFRKSVDDHSLVFEFNDRALFLSDLNEGAMNEMAERYMKAKNSYKLIKSAHHGTRLGMHAFKNAIDDVENIVHCCGPANPRYKGPTKRYMELSPESKMIYCTDWNFSSPKWDNPLPREYTIFSRSKKTFNI